MKKNEPPECVSGVQQLVQGTFTSCRRAFGFRYSLAKVRLRVRTGEKETQNRLKKDSSHVIQIVGLYSMRLSVWPGLGSVCQTASLPWAPHSWAITAASAQTVLSFDSLACARPCTRCMATSTGSRHPHQLDQRMYRR